MNTILWIDVRMEVGGSRGWWSECMQGKGGGVEKDWAWIEVVKRYWRIESIEEHGHGIGEWMEGMNGIQVNVSFSNYTLKVQGRMLLEEN